jgi:metal-responsive CopG/Arc/MetJ family transcriptional regulator
MSMKTITVTCPDALHAQLDQFIEQGWARDLNQAILEALRRFLESHRPELTRAQIEKDVEWGLHGDD